MGDHLFLFFFETTNDTERLLCNEPWRFDKHLVLFHCLNGARNVQNLNFTSTKFWVQLHGLPIDRLDIPTAIQIGKTIGMVSELEWETDMISGDFLRVRVEVDVSRPLCRGRKVVLNDEEEVWISFKYEKLPNFCFWCGMVCHDDKDCDRWLSSEGSLPLNSQEFGAWMRANPFSARRKTFCSVPGVEVFEQHHSRKEVTPEEPVEATTSPSLSSHTANDGDSTEGRGTNLGNLVSVVTDSDINASLNHAPHNASQPNQLFPTFYTEQKSFENQIEEIELALKKYDTMIDSKMDIVGTKISLQLNLDSLMDRVSINAKECNPKISGNPNGTLATSDSTTIPTSNSILRKWKQLARLAHTDDSSMQSSSSKKRTSDECGIEQTRAPCKKVQVSQELLDSSYLMAEAARQPCQDK